MGGEDHVGIGRVVVQGAGRHDLKLRFHVREQWARGEPGGSSPRACAPSSSSGLPRQRSCHARREPLTIVRASSRVGVRKRTPSTTSLSRRREGAAVDACRAQAARAGLAARRKMAIWAGGRCWGGASEKLPPSGCCERPLPEPLPPCLLARLGTPPHQGEGPFSFEMMSRSIVSRAAAAAVRAPVGARAASMNLGPTDAQAAALDALKPGKFGHVATNPRDSGADPAKCPSLAANEYLLVSEDAKIRPDREGGGQLCGSAHAPPAGHEAPPPRAPFVRPCHACLSQYSARHESNARTYVR